jgi:hypothetical protein
MVGAKRFSLLAVELKNGDREFFCLDSTVSKDRLLSILERRGLKVMIREETLSQEAFKR